MNLHFRAHGLFLKLSSVICFIVMVLIIFVVFSCVAFLQNIKLWFQSNIYFIYLFLLFVEHKVHDIFFIKCTFSSQQYKKCSHNCHECNSH